MNVKNAGQADFAVNRFCTGAAPRVLRARVRQKKNASKKAFLCVMFLQALPPAGLFHQPRNGAALEHGGVHLNHFRFDAQRLEISMDGVVDALLKLIKLIIG